MERFVRFCRVFCRVGALAALLLLGTGAAAAKIRVVASINDLGSIASAVGGDQVEVLSIARPNADVHRVEVLPSYMVRVSKAEVYLKVGLGLDQWADQIIDGSRNARLVVVDCSRDINALEKPTGRVDASMGDVHPNGNPHYWLDPRNGGVVAHGIAEALGRLDPAHTSDYETRADDYTREAESAFDQARQTASALPVRAMLTYHASWIYFAQAMGLEIAGTVEPVPGIPPTGRHLQDLVELIKERHIPILLQEPYFSDEAGQFLARETGIRVIKLSPSCDTVEAGSYLGHFRQIADAITRTNVGMIPN